MAISSPRSMCCSHAYMAPIACLERSLNRPAHSRQRGHYLTVYSPSQFNREPWIRAFNPDPMLGDPQIQVVRSNFLSNSWARNQSNSEYPLLSDEYSKQWTDRSIHIVIRSPATSNDFARDHTLTSYPERPHRNDIGHRHMASLDLGWDYPTADTGRVVRHASPVLGKRPF